GSDRLPDRPAPARADAEEHGAFGPRGDAALPPTRGAGRGTGVSRHWLADYTAGKIYPLGVPGPPGDPGRRELNMAKSKAEDVVEQGRAAATGLLAGPEEHRRAFVSAPPGVDTSVLRDALLRRGIEPYELDEVGAEGRSVYELLED